jgi:signal peptidase II
MSAALARLARGLGRRRFELTIVGVIVVADQITKALVSETLAVHQSVNVIPGLLDLTHVRNTGAAFGLLSGIDFPFKPVILTVVATGALVAIGAYALRLSAHETLARVGLALILGGALGNLVDRATAQYVVDFVDVYWRGYHFWAFNVADAAITVGAGVVIVDMLRTGSNVPTAV